MKVNNPSRKSLGRLVAQFLKELHRFDAGRTLPLLHESKLTTPKLAVLEFAGEPRTVSAISQHLGLSLPATSQLIQRMVERGFIRRSESSVDRRQRQIILAPAGQALLAAVASARATRFEAALAVLPEAVATRLESALGATIQALDLTSGPPSSRSSTP
jgi:DNA-binding MarR family transcriptional regulator